MKKLSNNSDETIKDYITNSSWKRWKSMNRVKI